MTVNEELAYQHLVELAGEADRYGMTIMISAEEETKKDGIVALYKRLSESNLNIGITLQVYLHRKEDDLEAIKSYSGRIRPVKGAYQESEEIALPRSEQLRAYGQEWHLYFFHRLAEYPPNMYRAR